MAWLPARASFDDEQSRIFDEILSDTKQSWWIKGYAGTGKTMLLAHLADEYIQAGYDCAYVTYTHALKDVVNEALVELGHDRNALPIFTVDRLNSIKREFDLLLVDEVQDLQQDKIAKLLRLGKRFIFAGDLNQSIFLQAAKPERVRTLLGRPRVVELRDIHRLPEAISYASHLIYEEADSAENALVDVVEDSTVNIVSARSTRSQVSWTYKQALREARPTKPSAILLSTHKEIEQFLKELCKSESLPLPPPVKKGSDRDYTNVNLFLKNNGLPILFFGGTTGGKTATATKSRTVFLMTLHSAKGLEFDSVFMPFMDSERMICPYPPLKNRDDWQRRFAYVGVTRTRLNFYACYTGTQNSILDLLENESLDRYLNHISV